MELVTIKRSKEPLRRPKELSWGRFGKFTILGFNCASEVLLKCIYFIPTFSGKNVSLELQLIQNLNTISALQQLYFSCL